MSRYRLSWYELTERLNGDWLVKLPLCDVYSALIDAAFPDLPHIGWRPATKTACYTYLKGATKAAVTQLRAFLELLKECLVLRLNKTIEAHFTDELDQCMALDFNFEEAETHTYTGIGELEYAAKYQQDKGSIDKLAELMPAIRERHPNFHRSDWIASIPGNPNKPFHLPGELVKRIAKERTTPVLALRKRKATPQLKSLPMAKKLETLENAFELGDNVDGCSVLLVDDLYQSGTTMWTLAKLLKQHGASDVYGLTCVKSWRDTDNQ